MSQGVQPCCRRRHCHGAAWDFKKLIEQIDCGDGVKVQYHEGRVRSSLWVNAQKRPYVGVWRKNQPVASVPFE